MKNIKKKIRILSVILSILSIFTPIIFHIGSSLTFIYYFWSWGLILSVGLTSSEIGLNYNTALDFLIPVSLATIFIIIGAFLTLNGLRKNKWKHSLIGSIITITTPLFLSIVWQLIYTVGMGYPTFWGSYGGYNYFLPGFSLYLQLIAGFIALISFKVNGKHKER